MRPRSIAVQLAYGVSRRIALAPDGPHHDATHREFPGCTVKRHRSPPHGTHTKTLCLARYVIHEGAHLSQGVRSAGDEKKRVDTSYLPTAYLVKALGPRADHVVGVGVF